MSDPRAQDRLREAARWFAARRRGVMSVDERALYEGWLDDAHNVSAMNRVERAWSMLDAAHGLFPDTAPPSESRPRSRFARPALMAAMCVVTLGIGVLSYSDHTGFWTALNWTDR